MHDALKNFERRHREVQRKHSRLAQGYVTRLGRNGVIEHHPKRDYTGHAAMPLMILTVTFVALKTMLLTGLGAEAYEGHLATLSDGGAVERMGAWLMQHDPLTGFLAGLLGGR
ncbi:hypothetical protein [Roseivivax sp. CAU 1761]